MVLRLMFVRIASGERYRGLYRYAHLNFVFDYPEEHYLHQLWDEVTEVDARKGYFDDPRRAREILHTINQFEPPSERCELIEVTDYQAKPQVGTSFFGYDVVSTYSHSYLEYMSTLGPPSDDGADIHAVKTLEDVTRTFSLLADRYFIARLNQNGLFDNYADARLFAEDIAAMNFIRPNFYDPVPFIPVGIWYVDGPSE
jgi:hypothetical protein